VVILAQHVQQVQLVALLASIKHAVGHRYAIVLQAILTMEAKCVSNVLISVKHALLQQATAQLALTQPVICQTTANVMMATMKILQPFVPSVLIDALLALDTLTTAPLAKAYNEIRLYQNVNAM
jgi:hypothetical protein